MDNTVADAIRRLSAALKQACSGWIPVQDLVIETLEEGLSSGSYDENNDELIDDLKTDPAVYASVLRQLGSQHRGSGVQIIDTQYALEISHSHSFDPASTLGSLSHQELGNLLGRTRQLGASHSLLAMEEFQAAMIEEVTVATISAETLAFALGQDPELAYSTALLRSLGTSLAAWNFPKEFSTAFYKLPADISLSERLTKTLGFAPEMLGNSLVLDWGLTKDIANALNTNSRNKDSIGWSLTEDSDANNQLVQICEISECLAKVVHVEQQAGALDTWPAVQRAFDELLGPYGLQMVLEQAREKLLLSSPHPISLPLPPILEAMAKKLQLIEKRFSALKQNTYLDQMPADPRKRIQQFYRSYDSANAGPQNIFGLFDQLLPQLGFARATLYEKSTNADSMEPIYTFGTSDIARQHIPLSRTFGYGKNVVTAYRLKSLVSEPRTRRGEHYFNIAVPIKGAKDLPQYILSVSSMGNYFSPTDLQPQHYVRALATLLGDVTRFSR